MQDFIKSSIINSLCLQVVFLVCIPPFWYRCGIYGRTMQQPVGDAVWPTRYRCVVSLTHTAHLRSQMQQLRYCFRALHDPPFKEN